jgi:hypothetical protein
MRLPLLALLPLLGACNDGPGGQMSDWDCEDATVTALDVTGVYRYQGDRSPFLLRGTITFEQTGDMVRVVDTTYDNANDRALEGLGTLVDNRLDIVLVPINGDLDYQAEITFLFSPDGATFCCGFSDTNDDAGPLGSYFGERQ